MLHIQTLRRNAARALRLAVAALLSLSLLLAPLHAMSANGGISRNADLIHPDVYVNGQLLQSDVPAVIVDGTTLVPMRAIFERLGASVDWDARASSVTGARHQREVVYRIGENRVLVNGRYANFAGTPGRIDNGRTLVPLRVIGESFGADVHYDASVRSVLITMRPAGTNHVHEPSDSELARYRVTLPYQTMLDGLPAWIAHVREKSTRESLLFFGDSTTWGSYLGRTEALPYAVGQSWPGGSFNLGVPGFTAGHIAALLPYALDGNAAERVVVQLQYFWGASTGAYAGLAAKLAEPRPPAAAAAALVRAAFGNDADAVEPSYASYAEQPAALVEARIARGKELFAPRGALDPELERGLRSMSALFAARPNVTFYVYVPPYLLGEAYRHADLTEEQFRAYVARMQAVFAGLDNVRFRDFNEESWRADEFIDWLHRSAQGEQRLAGLMLDWLAE